MGAAASASSASTSPNGKWRRKAALVGAVANHARKHRLPPIEGIEVASPEDSTRQIVPEKGERQYGSGEGSTSSSSSRTTTVPTTAAMSTSPHPAEELDEQLQQRVKGHRRLPPEAKELLARITTITARTDFVFLDNFRALGESSGMWDLPEPMYKILNSFNMHVKLVVLQPKLCVDTAVGVRLVISEFGLLNITAAFATYGPQLPGGQSKLLKAYLEHGLASMFDLPFEAVVVAPWIPGHVAVECCLESNTQKWDHASKATLSHVFEQRLRQSHNAVSIFQNLATQKRARSLPVTFAAGVIQRAWRRRPQKQRRRRGHRGDRRGDGRGGGIRDSGGAGGGDGDGDVAAIPIPRLQQPGRRVVTPAPAIKQFAESSFAEKGQRALMPLWRTVTTSGGNGVLGADLAALGKEVASHVQSYEHTFVEFPNQEVIVRTVRWIEPTAVALRKSGMQMVGSGEDNSPESAAPPAAVVVDEFDSILSSAPTVCSAYNGHEVARTTLVIQLRLKGLAAVLRRDLFHRSFDTVVCKVVRRIAHIPQDLPVFLLGKKYGSVVVFVGVETAAS